MLFIVATNVLVSRPPERRPSGRPTAHASKKPINQLLIEQNYRISALQITEYSSSMVLHVGIEFCSNFVSNSRDIPDMDKYRQDDLNQDKCHCELESVLNATRSQPLKFRQNWVSISGDIADIEFVCGGWVGLQSHFHV